MAKNNNRKLFGRGKLSNWMRDEDDSRPGDGEPIEERRPSWAEDMDTGRTEDADDPREADRTEDAEKTDHAAAVPEREDGEAEDGETESAPSFRASQEADDEDDVPRRTRVIQAKVNREEAEEAWEREAQRVESSQTRRRTVDSDRESDEDEAGPGGKKGGKKGGAKKKRSAPSRSEAEERRSFVHTICVVVVCGVLFVMVALMVASNFIQSPLLALPRKMVTAIVTPVQRFFSGISDGVVSYLRTLKIRGNLEYEYEQLLIQLDEYATQIAINDELRNTIDSLYDLLDEQQRNRDMNPLTATVIGHDTSNYFSNLTLDVGSSSGVSDYMAVVAQGGLVGVTYNVTENKCEVRCIIDSDCTVAGLVQSSRDQGSVKGTLGTNGEPMCRMYYLPDSSLPRPGDVVVTSGVGLEFPKGIPIGYIRESTRGMEDNKSYVVVEPVVDFQHLEYVTVYRYRPSYAEEAQDRVNTSSNLRLETMDTPRPVPTWSANGVSDLLFAPATAGPETTPAADTPAPSTAPGQTAAPTATPDPNAPPAPENLTYQAADTTGATPTPSPRPTHTPSPTPVPTPDPGAMTVEDDE